MRHQVWIQGIFEGIGEAMGRVDAYHNPNILSKKKRSEI